MASTFDDQFVSMAYTSFSFTDKKFYAKMMNEVSLDQDAQYTSYPVQVQALESDWIIKTEDGKNFLQQILYSENMDLFKIPSLQMLIQFLYRKQKNSLLMILFPIYFLQVVTYEWMMRSNEEILSHLITPDTVEAGLTFATEIIVGGVNVSSLNVQGLRYEADGVTVTPADEANIKALAGKFMNATKVDSQTLHVYYNMTRSQWTEYPLLNITKADVARFDNHFSYKYYSKEN